MDGDRESERLIDLTAEVTSTWWTCVGEGNVRVPPPLLGYGMVSFGMRGPSPMIPEMSRRSNLRGDIADYLARGIEIGAAE